jgi:hypothetical protein
MTEDIVAILVLFPSVVVFTALILRFKLKKKELELRGSDPELGREVDALRDEMADLQEHTHTQLADMQERLDFAERLLTAGRASLEDKSE